MVHHPNSMQVFVENKVIRFLSDPGGAPHEQVIDLNAGKDIDLWAVFTAYIRNPEKSQLTFLTNDPGRMMRKFAGNFVSVEAAGGVVKNPEGRLLVIYRLGKWDLPKGKVDRGEKPAQTAIREVEEECGVNSLQIIAALPHTLHAYPWRDGQWALKKTHWFEMRAPSQDALTPQKEEGIEAVRWAGPEDLPVLLESTYASLRALIAEALSGIK